MPDKKNLENHNVTLNICHQEFRENRFVLRRVLREKAAETEYRGV